MGWRVAPGAHNPAFFALERRGAVAHLLIDRPDKRNAFTHAMWTALPALLDAVAADPDIKVLVLGSTSPDAFCAGADIAEFETSARNPRWRAANQAAICAVQTQLARFAKPTIAAIAGVCVGGGCGLALACDLRLAAQGSRFGITPAKLGLVYSLHDTKLLVDLVGPSQAKRILFTGALVPADEALRIGLVDAVHAPEALAAAVDTLAAELCAASQHSIRQIKRVIGMILDGAVADTAETLALFADAFDGPDHAEGVAAFLAKRRPDFPVR